MFGNISKFLRHFFFNIINFVKKIRFKEITLKYIILGNFAIELVVVHFIYYKNAYMRNFFKFYSL